MPSKTSKKLRKRTIDLLVPHLLGDWDVTTLFDLVHMDHYKCQLKYCYHFDESMSYIYK